MVYAISHRKHFTELTLCSTVLGHEESATSLPAKQAIIRRPEAGSILLRAQNLSPKIHIFVIRLFTSSSSKWPFPCPRVDLRGGPIAP
jgi:hypothetical protein